MKLRRALILHHLRRLRNAAINPFHLRSSPQHIRLDFMVIKDEHCHHRAQIWALDHVSCSILFLCCYMVRIHNPLCAKLRREGLKPA